MVSIGARSALDLAESPNRFLSTVQIGITLIGILSGVLGGATLSEPLANWLARVPTLRPVSRELAVGLVVLVITYLSLVVGELIPKRLGLADPERVAVRLARSDEIPLAVDLPGGAAADFLDRSRLRLLRVKDSLDPPVTEEEIKVLMEQGTQVGVFEQAETNMVEGVFRLGGRLVRGADDPAHRDRVAQTWTTALTRTWPR